MTASIIRGDARSLPLADNSVDLVVTSPPYFGLRSYQDTCGACRDLTSLGQDPREAFADWTEHARKFHHYKAQIGAEPTPAEFVGALLDVTRECVRVLKPCGSMWVNLGDKYSGAQAQNFGGKSHAGASAKVWAQTNPKNTGIPNKSLMGIPWRYALRCIDDLGLILRAEVIWSKPNGLPESVTDRVRRSHEQWFHFVLEPRYFSAVDEVREEHLTSGRGSDWQSRKAHVVDRPGYLRQDDVIGMDNAKAAHALGKLPGSVWSIPTQPLTVPASLGIDHFAAFPMEWPRRIVKAWSPQGGIVLDPFGGTGTTALVASVLGRHGISNDYSADYCRLAAWRTTDPGQRAAAMQVEKPAAEIPGQADLFGGEAA